jgi:hypothetical protein
MYDDEPILILKSVHIGTFISITDVSNLILYNQK